MRGGGGGGGGDCVRLRIYQDPSRGQTLGSNPPRKIRCVANMKKSSGDLGHIEV